MDSQKTPLKSPKLRESNPTIGSGNFSTNNLSELLNIVAASAQVKPEHRDDRKSRIIRETADAKHERFRKTARFCIGAFLPIGLIIFCGWILVVNRFSDSTKALAMQLISAIVGGYIGYVLGEKNKEP